MIASLSGRVTGKNEDNIVLEIGGVGLLVFIPAQLHGQVKVGENLNLYTHLVVREDSLTLFGFSSAEERDYFILSLGVSGIGPRLALAILSTLNPEAIRRAVFSEQAEIFSRVPGIGKKTSQKMLLYLSDKVKDVDGLEPVAAMDDSETQVLEALVALGYSVVEAQAAIQAIPKDAPDDVETRIRLALRYFSS